MVTTIIIRWEKVLKDACQQLNGGSNAPNYALNLGDLTPNLAKGRGSKFYW
jgi:hypothetical protein